MHVGTVGITYAAADGVSRIGGTEMVDEAGWWGSRLGPIKIGLHEANETHHKRTVACQIGKETNMFGPPNHFDDGGKVDHRGPFRWIRDPAPLLLDSVD